MQNKPTERMPQDKQCPNCWCDMDPQKAQFKLEGCNHVICFRCTDRIHKRCPTCYQPVKRMEPTRLTTSTEPNKLDRLSYPQPCLGCGREFSQFDPHMKLLVCSHTLCAHCVKTTERCKSENCKAPVCVVELSNADSVRRLGFDCYKCEIRRSSDEMKLCLTCAEKKRHNYRLKPENVKAFPEYVFCTDCFDADHEDHCGEDLSLYDEKRKTIKEMQMTCVKEIFPLIETVRQRLAQKMECYRIFEQFIQEFVLSTDVDLQFKDLYSGWTNFRMLTHNLQDELVNAMRTKMIWGDLGRTLHESPAMDMHRNLSRSGTFSTGHRYRRNVVDENVLNLGKIVPKYGKDGQPDQLEDLEGGKNLQQYLVILLHALKCDDRSCLISYCTIMKRALQHSRKCDIGRRCTYKHCSTSRMMIDHWTVCRVEFECQLCTPVINVVMQSPNNCSPDQDKMRALLRSWKPDDLHNLESGGKIRTCEPVESAVVDKTATESLEVNGLVAETVPETLEEKSLVAETVPETLEEKALVAETVPETLEEKSLVAETVPETLEEKALVAETVPETLEEKALVAETVPETLEEKALVAETAAKTLEMTDSAETVAEARDESQTANVNVSGDLELAVSNSDLSLVPTPTDAASQLDSQVVQKTKSASTAAESEVSVYTPSNYPPLKPASVKKDWHEQVINELRHFIIRKLLTEMGSAAVADFNNVMYARQVEHEIYEASSDKKEYFHRMAEKVLEAQVLVKKTEKNGEPKRDLESVTAELTTSNTDKDTLSEVVSSIPTDHVTVSNQSASKAEVSAPTEHVTSNDVQPVDLSDQNSDVMKELCEKLVELRMMVAGLVEEEQKEPANLKPPHTTASPDHE